MKAAIWTDYGPPDVLRVGDVERPTPTADEVLVRIRASTVTVGDCELRALALPPYIRLPMRLYVGLRKPKRITVLGQELAGVVEAVGGDVTSFASGDEVFAATGFGFGGNAEYACLPVGGSWGAALAPKPAGVSFEAAAAVPVGGLNALYFLRQADVRPGETVLVNGAGGSIGTFAVQLAKLSGAAVVAVDSGEKLAMLRSIGADRVVDYEREDFTAQGATYDVVFDVVGESPFSRSLRSLADDGRYLLANPDLAERVRGPLAARTGGTKVVLGQATQTTDGLRYLGDLIEAGEIRAVVDRRYPLDDVVEAHGFVESGRKQGNVVLTSA